MHNALQAIELSIDHKKELWYEAFTITDEIEQVDISKAKNMF